MGSLFHHSCMKSIPLSKALLEVAVFLNYLREKWLPVARSGELIECETERDGGNSKIESALYVVGSTSRKPDQASSRWWV